METKWQCKKCGKFRTVSGAGTPIPESCPEGGHHVYVQVGRFIKFLFALVPW